jgi:peroxiredoxin
MGSRQNQGLNSLFQRFTMSINHTVTPASLRSRFQALDDERARTWTPEAFAVNRNQRAALISNHDPASHVQVGDILPDVSLPTVGGETVSLETISGKGRSVLIFFRFSGCPACNIALPYYRDTLWPALSAAGISLVAISPQPLGPLNEIVHRHALPFPVASDTGLKLSRALGITYKFDEPSRRAAEAKGGDSGILNGLDQTWELPKPTVLLIGAGRVVHFVDVSPDWMDRSSSETILHAVRLTTEATSHAA